MMRLITYLCLFVVLGFLSVSDGLAQNVTANPSLTTAGAIPITTSVANQVTQDPTFKWTPSAQRLDVPVGFTMYIGNELFLSMYPNNGHTSAGMFISLNSGNLTNSGFNNVALGINSLSRLTSGAGNVALGHDTLDYVTSNYNNTAVGYRTFEFTTGDDNTGIGWSAGNSATSGTALTAIGYSALYDVTTAFWDTAVGFKSLRQEQTGGFNVAVGSFTGAATVAGTANTFVGMSSGSSGDLSYSGAFGYNAQATKSHQIALGTSAEEVYAPGHFNSPSYQVSGTPGMTATITVVGKTGSTCNLVFASGLLTGTTCP